MQEAPSFIVRSKARGKRRAGQLYEVKAHEHLCSRTEFYFPAPWFAFTARGSARVRWCQPDGIILDFVLGKITIVEIKLKHTRKAWWQLRQLYEPVVKALLGREGYVYSVLEVTGILDPHTPFPEHFHFTRDPAVVKTNGFGIYIYNPRRR